MMRFAPMFAHVFAALTLMVTPAVAQDAAPNAPVDLAAQYTGTLIAGGEWAFTAPRGAPKGSPTCTESWTFRADGSMTVVSGSQTVENTWRVINDQGFERLFTTGLSSTEGIDCMGERANPADYPMEEGGGAALLFFNGGNGGYLCNPVLMENPDGTKTPFYDDEECWGELRAVAKIEAAGTQPTPAPAADPKDLLINNR